MQEMPTANAAAIYLMPLSATAAVLAAASAANKPSGLAAAIINITKRFIISSKTIQTP
jgi:hypothetical protein